MKMDMKMAMFTTKESYAEWLRREIELLRENGLKHSKEELENAKNGIGKAEWLKMNNISENTEVAEEAWGRRLQWLEGYVKFIERKIRMHEKELSKVC